MQKKNKKKKLTNTSVEHKTEKSKACKLNNLPVWQIVSGVLFIAFVLFLVLFLTESSTTGIDDSGVVNTTEMQNVANETVSFLKSNFPVSELSLNTVLKEKNLYKMSILVEDQELDIYTSMDGELIFIPGGAPINKTEFLKLKEENPVDEQPSQEPAPQNLTKSDKPVVELFVMSHCPFGTQMEKGILPVVDLLSDKIDFQLKYVNYVMHGYDEVYEQLLQYCIMQEKPDKFYDYLGCFLEDGNTEVCLNRNSILRADLETCISETDQEYAITESYNNNSTAFLIYDADNKKYGIKGSPALIVNGTKVSTNRDSQSLLNTICGAFNTEPAECSETLSNVNPSPGFGYGSTGSNTNAECN